MSFAITGVVIAGIGMVGNAQSSSIQGGARGLDMGRNIFQSENGPQMAEAISKIVHEGFTDDLAWEFFQDATKA